MTDLLKSKNIWFYNFIDSNNSIYGIAIIKKGFEAFLHKHVEPETYYFIWGKGVLNIDNKEEIIKSPSKILIKSNKLHAMKPLSNYVILIYYFPKGPFNSIKYNFTNVKIKAKL